MQGPKRREVHIQKEKKKRENKREADLLLDQLPKNGWRARTKIGLRMGMAEATRAGTPWVRRKGTASVSAMYHAISYVQLPNPDEYESSRVRRAGNRTE